MVCALAAPLFLTRLVSFAAPRLSPHCLLGHPKPQIPQPHRKSSGGPTPTNPHPHAGNKQNQQTNKQTNQTKTRAGGVLVYKRFFFKTSLRAIYLITTIVPMVFSVLQVLLIFQVNGWVDG